MGTTQLTVSGNHGQPYLSGSKRTWRSAVRNFHFQNQFASLPAQFMQPVKALQPGRYCRHQITKSHYGQRSDPATLLIIAGEDWPAAIRVLGVEQKVLRTFDVAYRALSRVRARSSRLAQLPAAKRRPERPSPHTGAV